MITILLKVDPGRGIRTLASQRQTVSVGLLESVRDRRLRISEGISKGAISTGQTLQAGQRLS